MSRATLTALTVVVLTLGGAGVASAGTLTETSDSDNPDDVAVIQVSYTAAPGERNDVTLSFANDVYTFHDGGSSTALSLKGDCTVVDPKTVTCPDQKGNLTFLGIDLGDADDHAVIGSNGREDDTTEVDGGPGNDRLQVAPGAKFGNLDGGLGDDVLTGADGADVLRGGAGADTLIGGGGNDLLFGEGTLSSGAGPLAPPADGADTLDGGPGDDTLAGFGSDTAPVGGPGPDKLDGGPGVNVASYQGEIAPVTVDLAAHTQAGGALRDQYTNISGVIGSVGDDTLLGSAGDDVLLGRAGDDTIDGRGGGDLVYGGTGDDRLTGGAGDDLLVAGLGSDTMDAGTGNDVLDAEDAEQPEDEQPAFIPRDFDEEEAKKPKGDVDMLSCGAGKDAVRLPEDDQKIPGGCEQIQIGSDGVRFAVAPVRLSHLTFAVSCPRKAPMRCMSDVRLLDTHGRVLALGTAKVRPGASHLTLNLTRAGMRLRKVPRTLVLSANGDDLNRGDPLIWLVNVRR